jgi:hypothetical protein
MKLMKSAAIKSIQSSNFLDAYQLERTEDSTEHRKQMKQINDLMERRYRQGKKTTILLVE